MSLQLINIIHEAPPITVFCEWTGIYIWHAKPDLVKVVTYIATGLCKAGSYQPNGRGSLGEISVKTP